MYQDVGNKIKKFAEVIGKLCIAIGCIGALICFLGLFYGLQSFNLMPWILGFIISVLFAFVGYISSLPLFCMGQLVDDIHKLQSNSEKLVKDQAVESKS